MNTPISSGRRGFLRNIAAIAAGAAGVGGLSVIPVKGMAAGQIKLLKARLPGAKAAE
jgi:hypothetical protein